MSARWTDSQPPCVLEDAGRSGTLALWLILLALIAVLGATL